MENRWSKAELQVKTNRRFPGILVAVPAVMMVLFVGTADAQIKRTVIAKKLFSPPMNTVRVRIPATSPTSTTVANASIPLSSTFLLHSLPTASKIIYLDFDGHTTTNTDWNSGSSSIVTAPFSIDSNRAFSNTELLMIQEIWQRVAEMYSPFNVDVTTQAPATSDLINSGGSDTRWGIRVAIGTTTPSPAPSAGGVAFVGSFSASSDTPCFVFPASLANYPKYISDAAAHEVGHTLGLIHDGRTTPEEEYYYGQGSGFTGWAPVMGVGYDQNLVQWSKGEYLNANNFEDDLTIITTQNGFSYRTDDFANDRTSSTEISGARGTGSSANIFNVSQSGVISVRTDTDWFKLTTGSGNLVLQATGGPVNSMLDIQMDLYNSNGSLLASNNPTDLLTASVSRSVTAGVYYVRIDGVGNGQVLGTGYSDYGSLGQYTISGTFVAPPTVNASTVIASYIPATKTLTLTGDTKANTVNVMYQSGTLKIEGANGTNIGTAGSGGSVTTSTSATFSHSGKLILNANLGDGDDGIGLVGIDSSTTTIVLGNGTDKAAFTLCNIGTLNVDGGAGTDLVTATSSTIGTFNRVNVP